MDIDKALTEIDGVLVCMDEVAGNVREFSEAEAEEFQLCVDKLHEIIADYCSRSH